MLSAIRKFMEKKMAAESGGGHSADAVRLATAALLVEVMRMDKQADESERLEVARILRERFEMSARDSDELISLAEKEAGDAAEYYQFTSRINQDFSMPEKEKMIEHLWQVAYADGRLHSHEEYLVRKVAGLIGVEHTAFITAKHRARDAGPA
ncbi:MAG: TerB family tellurite resistance protein [Mariprofundaceae bacterium]